ncbi:MAG: DNA polymerase I [Treponema sp.]|nr:DNA polymerase I [Treponema sp.]
MIEKKPLYIVDGYGLIYRSYFAFFKHPILNKDHINISALFGFARTLIQLLDSGFRTEDMTVHRPEYLALVFDSPVKTFRHDQYPEYKASRDHAPEDLHAQVPLIEKFVRALGVPLFSLCGYEADDIIATLVQRAHEESRCCYIISEDKDLLQLIDSKTFVLRHKVDSALYEMVDEATVRAQWGIRPDQILDLLSMMGDKSDNIPGIARIGEKTAARLLSRYGTLDEIYRNIAAIKGSVATYLSTGHESARLSKTLITLCTTVPIEPCDLDSLSVTELDRHAGAVVLIREGMQETAKMLDPTVTIDYTPQVPSLSGSGVYRAVLDRATLQQYVMQARKQRYIALDFETDSLDSWHAHPVGISFALKPKEAFYVPVAHHAGIAPSLEPYIVKDLFEQLFADSAVTVITHNLKYDYAVARAWGISHFNCRFFDTMIAAWLIEPDRGSYSLDSLARSFFNYEGLPFNAVVPERQTFDTVPLDQAIRYAAEDADLCMRLKTLFEPQLAGLESLFWTLEMPLVPILAHMEHVGVKVELESLKKYRVEISAELKNVETTLYATVGHSFNPASPKQVQEILFTERNLPPTRKTRSGYSTDSDILEELKDKDPVPALMLRYRLLSKLQSAYLDTLINGIDRESRIHTSFIQTGTATGRLSSREPNLQNIPIREAEGRRIREAFIASEGMSFIAADYSQIELIMLAHISGDEHLLEALIHNADIHVRTASLVFHIEEQSVSSEQRRMAKAINFGVMYGMSAFKLGHTLGISRHEAASFIKSYFDTYKGVRSFMDSTIKETEKDGFITTLFGRRRTIFGINSSNRVERAAAQRMAINSLIQGSAADVVKKAMIDLDLLLKTSASRAQLLMQVHDELIVESPEPEKDSVLVLQAMEHAVQLKVPLHVEVRIGQRWA